VENKKIKLLYKNNPMKKIDLINDKIKFRDSKLSLFSNRPYIAMPPQIHASRDSLREDEIYVLDDGFSLYLFVGGDVDSKVKNCIFTYENCSDSLVYAKVAGKNQSMKISTTSNIGKKLWRIIWLIRRYTSMGCTSEKCIRPTFSPVFIVLGNGVDDHREEKDEILEKEIKKKIFYELYKSCNTYVDFICELQSKIRYLVDVERIHNGM